jgi:hypothetical protein
MRRRGATALLAGLLAAFAPALHAETLRVHYNVSLIGLPLGTAGLTGVFIPATYRVDVNARLTGLASLLSAFKGAATAAGTLSAGRVVPSAYAISTSSSQGTRTVRMAVAGGTVRGVDISPPIEERVDRVPLTAADKRGIIDPISALVMPVSGTAPVIGPAACNRTIPVFDGYVRFDIGMSYVGQQTYSTSGYSGPVAVCSVRYRPIAGHRRDKRATQFMTDNKDMEAWLAPVGGTRVVVPVHISVKTMIGTTVIDASEFLVDSTKRAAASTQKAAAVQRRAASSTQ